MAIKQKETFLVLTEKEIHALKVEAAREHLETLREHALSAKDRLSDALVKYQKAGLIDSDCTLEDWLC